MTAKLDVRSSGVLLHPTSLPGPFGIGDIGPAAHRFAERLAACGQSWWQMLPVVPPGACCSPYSALSSFAGNPWLLSLESLAERGWLPPEDLRPPAFPERRADFEAAERFKRRAFRAAFAAFESSAGASQKRELQGFRERNAAWLEDYSLYAALRTAHRGASWTGWDDGLRRRKPLALASAARSLDAELRYQRFLQWQFSEQWDALRRRCAALGVGFIGDVPIFVSHDSADVWASPEIFQLDAEGRPTAVAGVPPDYFSRTGQLWGNPLYRWDALRERGYDWWVQRFKAAFERFDAVRLDHFIGFHNYWEIPAGSKTAESGRWAPGPGAELFDKVRELLGPVEFIAEDLGAMTDEVRALRDRLGLPGLRVLQFSFGLDPDAPGFEPKAFPRNCVVYTGTHDNDTTVGWFNDKGSAASTRTPELVRSEHALLLGFLGTDGREIHWDLIRVALESSADTVIVPMQDLLGLGSEARMNVPATAEGNWRWRMEEDEFIDSVAERFARLTREFGRWPKR